MIKVDLTKEAETVWKEGVNFGEVLAQVTIKALEKYTDQMNKEMYVLRGLYDNPLATKQQLDKLIRENNEVLKKHGLNKSLQLAMELEI